MFRKEDVRLPGEGGIELSAWLFMPEQRRSEARPQHGHRASGRRLKDASTPAAECGLAQLKANRRSLT
jgi:hypothetical protein